MAHSPMPFRATRRQRGVPIFQHSASEMMMAVSGLRRRIFTFASDDTLTRAIRVSWDWFDDAVAVLYNTMEVRIALSMGSKLEKSPRFMDYNSVVRQVAQPITFKGYSENRLDLALPDLIDDDAYPFLPTDTITIGAAADAAPLLFPSVHSVVSDCPEGHAFGERDMRRGGDRSFLSFTEESGYEADMLYVERCIGISNDDFKLDPETFIRPSIPEFDTDLVYVILAKGTYSGGGKSHLLPFESMFPLSRIRDPVKVFATLGLDVHIRTVIKLFLIPMPQKWPFPPNPTIDCDRILGLGLKEFRALAQTPGVRRAEGIRLNTASIPSTGPCLRPADIYSIRDILIHDLPNLKDLSLSFVIDESSELDYTDDLLLDLPSGPLKCLIVHLGSKGQASSSKTSSRVLSFPFNLIRRLASCVIEGGSLVLHGQDLPGQKSDNAGMDLSAVITWIRARPPNIRRMISVMDYIDLGVGCTNDLSRLCFDYGTPMTVTHSLTYFFTSDLLGQIDRYLRNPSLSPRHPSKTPQTTISLLTARANAFDLNHQVMEEHWKGVRTEKDTLAARAAKILWDCKTAGMAEAPSLMTTKYPTLFDGLRKAAQNAQASQAKLNGLNVVQGKSNGGAASAKNVSTAK